MFTEDDIHKGLVKSEGRTFLAKEHAAFLEECSSTSEMIEKRIEQIQADLGVQKRRLILAKQREAIELIIASRGWSIHDISEDVVEFMDEVYPFVGTQREFDNQFLHQCDVDDD